MPRAESRFEYGGDSLLLLAVATVEHQLIGILISEQPESNQENLENQWIRNVPVTWVTTPQLLYQSE